MSDELEAALAAVGPRLRALRHEHETTLADLSATTGISVSTLSRLEAGQRRPTLELLLPLARAYELPIDELIGTPPTDDPRVPVRPVTRHGMTMIPLTRRATGLQAFKIVLPAGQQPSPPEPQTHEGYEWFYVLSGRVRLIIGEHDIVLGPGEAAEFDTRVPHRFWNAGTDPAEILSLFGPQGERLHLRARPRRPDDPRPGGAASGPHQHG